MFDWVLANWQSVLLVFTSAVTAASLVLKVLAPLTKADWDDKALARLNTLLGWLGKLSLNTPSKPSA